MKEQIEISWRNIVKPVNDYPAQIRDLNLRADQIPRIIIAAKFPTKLELLALEYT